MNRTQLQQNRNNMYHRGSNTPRYQRHHQSKPDRSFEESSDSAFFLGKLNKHLDRETIYRALTAEARRMNFYVRKLDMPYGDSRYKTGNKGYAFVHTRTREEATRMIKKGQIRLNNQFCEIKAYGGRMDTDSGTSTNLGGGLDSGVNTGWNTPRNSSWSKQVSQEEIERKVEAIGKSYRQRTSTMSSNSISENDDPYSYSNDNNNTSQSIDELHLEVQHQPDIPEEMETTPTGAVPSEYVIQDSTNYSSVFTHENVTPYILAKQTEAINSGMTAEQFNMAFVAFYEMRLQQLQITTAEEVANLQFGLYQKMQQICN
jgi:hypothetical protein